MTDKLFNAINCHDVRVSMTQRQARLLYDLIRERSAKREQEQKSATAIEEYVSAETLLTDLDSLGESIFFDAGLGTDDDV